MKGLSLRLPIAILTFALGIATAALWTIHRFNSIKQHANHISNESKPITGMEEDVSSEWQKVDMDGNATFYIPPSLKRVIHDPNPLYRDFRTDSMQFFTMYTRQDEGATCIVQKRKRVDPKAKLSEITVGGKSAILEYVDQITFEPYQNDPVLKGIIICVPDVGDGEHEFSIVAKYKNEQDYQNVRRIIDSIKFSYSLH